MNGELAIPGVLLRSRVFDPVVGQVWIQITIPNKNIANDIITVLEQVLELLEDQSRKVDQPIQALLMVGGFAGSEYLFKRVKVRIVTESLPSVSLLIEFGRSDSVPTSRLSHDQAIRTPLPPGVRLSMVWLGGR